MILIFPCIEVEAACREESNESLAVVSGACFREIHLKKLGVTDSHTHLFPAFHGRSSVALPLSNKGFKGIFLTKVPSLMCSTKRESFAQNGEHFCRVW